MRQQHISAKCRETSPPSTRRDPETTQIPETFLELHPSQLIDFRARLPHNPPQMLSRRPLRFLLVLSLMLGHAGAEPAVISIPWRPACDGATIEIVTEDSMLKSIRASAFHATAICEWTVHYSAGTPISAEYRETQRGRILEGDHAGESSGHNPITRIQTWPADRGQFKIEDERHRAELTDILVKARTALQPPR